MKIRDRYRTFLEFFGTTVPMREMASDSGLTGIGLRHDVDHSLEAALAMAEVEKEFGIRSTYYLLPTTKYWGAEGFSEACRMFQDWGHEVGYHCNVVAEWYRGEVDSMEEGIRRQTKDLHNVGVDLTGWAAHGDPDCYKGGFANYWMARELRGGDPMETETGISAEGVRDPRERYQLRYPANHKVASLRGSEEELWQVEMSGHGYLYHAAHVPYDRYFSDSGGSWVRSGTPLEAEKSEAERWQVLVHPEYWVDTPSIRGFEGTGKVTLSYPHSATTRVLKTEAEHISALREGEDGFDQSFSISRERDTLLLGAGSKYRSLFQNWSWGKKAGGGQNDSPALLLDSPPHEKAGAREEFGDWTSCAVDPGGAGATGGILQAGDNQAFSFEPQPDEESGACCFLEDGVEIQGREITRGVTGKRGKAQACMEWEIEFSAPSAGCGLYLAEFKGRLRRPFNSLLHRLTLIAGKPFASAMYFLLFSRLLSEPPVRLNHWKMLTTLPAGNWTVLIRGGKAPFCEAAVPALRTRKETGEITVHSVRKREVLSGFAPSVPFVRSLLKAGL